MSRLGKLKSGRSWLPTTVSTGPGKRFRNARAVLNLRAASPLGEVSRDDDDIGLLCGNVGEQRFAELSQMSAKVNVGHVDNDRHFVTIARRAMIDLALRRCPPGYSGPSVISELPHPDPLVGVAEMVGKPESIVGWRTES